VGLSGGIFAWKVQQLSLKGYWWTKVHSETGGRSEHMALKFISFAGFAAQR